VKKEEARLENGKLEDVIAKINQAAFRFALPRWGNYRHNFTRATNSTDSKV
tara:strand:+ start:2719 stop:2871 length:153 start_codon:yes stop_codon:yes gene_type:complete